MSNQYTHWNMDWRSIDLCCKTLVKYYVPREHLCILIWRMSKWAIIQNWFLYHPLKSKRFVDDVLVSKWNGSNRFLYGKWQCVQYELWPVFDINQSFINDKIHGLCILKVKGNNLFFILSTVTFFRINNYQWLLTFDIYTSTIYEFTNNSWYKNMCVLTALIVVSYMENKLFSLTFNMHRPCILLFMIDWLISKIGHTSYFPHFHFPYIKYVATVYFWYQHIIKESLNFQWVISKISSVLLITLIFSISKCTDASSNN